MRLLQLHSDFIEYELISREINEAEENISKTKTRLEDLVVTFVAVENEDDEIVASEAVVEIKKYLQTDRMRQVVDLSLCSSQLQLSNT